MIYRLSPNSNVMHHATDAMNGWAATTRILATLVFCAPLSARADALIPYVAVPWGQLFLLPIVILIEGALLYSLAGGRVLAAMFQSLVANLVSTAIGAALYIPAMSLFGENIFEWWLNGPFSSEAVRNALIAFVFAIVLWSISWTSETAVIARLRKVGFRVVAPALAWANLTTYVLLMGLALWFQH